MPTLRFFAAGVPTAKGTLRAFVAGGRAHVTNASGSAGKREKTWAGIVSTVALQAMRAVTLQMLNRTGKPLARAAEELEPAKPFSGPVSVVVVFCLPRPKAHYTTKGTLKEKAPRWVDKKPDSDKLIRSCLDAMTGVVYMDDAQVVQLGVQKLYADGPVGARFEVSQL